MIWQVLLGPGRAKLYLEAGLGYAFIFPDQWAYDTHNARI